MYNVYNAHNVYNVYKAHNVEMLHFSLGLMFEWQIPEKFVHQMYQILVQHVLLPHDEYCFGPSSLIKTKQLVTQVQMQNGSYNTYTSTLASSSSSRAFSLVGCHICISKYFTRKGHTTLSRTKNKKYLPQSEMRHAGIHVTNAVHLPQDWS